MILISLFYCSEQLFTHMYIWMIKKNSVKFNDLKKKTFTVEKTWNMLLMEITRRQKEFVVKHLGEYHHLHVKAIHFC